MSVPATCGGTGAGAAIDPALLLLADGRFPSGGHANSAGVEAAVAAGDVRDIPTLARYLEGRLATTGVTDAAFAAATIGACRDAPDERALAAALGQLDREYEARVLSPALRRTSRRLGRQLVRAGTALWPVPAFDHLADHTDGPHQPLALGALGAAIGCGPGQIAALVLHQLGAAVTTAGVRLLGLDPYEAAAVHAHVGSSMVALVEPADAWAVCRADELPANGGSLTEILAEDHGRWDARLFVA